MNAHSSVKGWCPGALRPMQSGDGLIVRVRVRGATLDPARALALTDLARRFGNGAIDLTRRANLQIRGVRPQTWTPLLDALRPLGLLAESEDAERVNIVEPPLGDLDPGALIDARAMARTLEAGLLADPALRALPGKFGFAIDGGGSVPLGSVGADVSLLAHRAEEGACVALVLGDERAMARRVAPSGAVAAALSASRAFLTFRRGRPGIRRMRHLLAEIGADALFGEAGLGGRQRTTLIDRRSPEPMFGLRHLGSVPMIGVGAPFGAWGAIDLAAMAEIAAASPAASLRVTPWRAILLAGLAPDQAEAALASLAARGLIVSGADPRRAIACCPGAPACASASVPTRDLAAAIAAQLNQTTKGSGLHISGCGKGCASSASGLALVGREGLYDLVEGRPGDPPVMAGLSRDRAMRAALDRFAP